MDITYLIDYVMTFVMDHFALVVGALIIFFSIFSARRKAQKAREEEAYPQDSEGQHPIKNFRDLMAEIEAELNGEEEAKPWEKPSPPVYREKRPASPRNGAEFPSSAEGPRPWERSVNIPPVTPKAQPNNIPVVPEVNVPNDLTKTDINVEKKKIKRPVKRNELVTAVVMSEVLGKPKGLQD